MGAYWKALGQWKSTYHLNRWLALFAFSLVLFAVAVFFPVAGQYQDGFILLTSLIVMIFGIGTLFVYSLKPQTKHYRKRVN